MQTAYGGIEQECVRTQRSGVETGEKGPGREQDEGLPVLALGYHSAQAG